MLAMKSLRLAVVFFALAVCAVTAATAAPACDVKAQVPDAARTFSTLSGSSPWVEYPSLGYAPDATGEGAMYAQYWIDPNGAPSVFMFQPGREDEIYIRYCFTAGGQLASIGLVVNTAWEWGYRLDGTVTAGVLQVQSSSFFNNYSGATIDRPAQADSIANALKPVLYLETSKLPFAALLAQPAKLPAR
jgi:hypothetical protein